MANSEGAREAEADGHSGSEGPVAGVIGVVGAGTMGAGIAQLACRAGAQALLHDAIPEALERGVQRVREGLTKEAARRPAAENHDGPFVATGLTATDPSSRLRGYPRCVCQLSRLDAGD